MALYVDNDSILEVLGLQKAGGSWISDAILTCTITDPLGRQIAVITLSYLGAGVSVTQDGITYPDGNYRGVLPGSHVPALVAGTTYTEVFATSNANYTFSETRTEVAQVRSLPPAPLPPPGPPTCDDQLILRAVDKTVDGACPVRIKGRSIRATQGVNATIEWELRDRQGNAINLDNCLDFSGQSAQLELTKPDQAGQILFRFRDTLGVNQAPVQQIGGTVYSAEQGLVRCVLIDAVTTDSSIYAMEVGIVANSGQLALVDRGLLIVERSLFGDLTIQGGLGPPTIDEIRDIIRDTVPENDLWNDFEFSDGEIVRALLSPVMEWNETPPPLDPLSPSNFPFRNAWMQATASYLLLSAAHGYRRNKLRAVAAGVEVDVKDRDAPYLQTALQMRQEWKEFILSTKIAMNAGLAVGSVQSTYFGRFY